MKKLGLLTVMLMLVAVPALVLVGCGGGAATPPTPTITGNNATFNYTMREVAQGATSGTMTVGFEVRMVSGDVTGFAFVDVFGDEAVSVTDAGVVTLNLVSIAGRLGNIEMTNALIESDLDEAPAGWQARTLPPTGAVYVSVRAWEVSGSATSASASSSAWTDAATWTRA